MLRHAADRSRSVQPGNSSERVRFVLRVNEKTPGGFAGRLAFNLDLFVYLFRVAENGIEPNDALVNVPVILSPSRVPSILKSTTFP